MIQLHQGTRTRDGAFFYCSGPTGAADALQASIATLHSPQYAPEVATYRSNAPSDMNLWNNSIFTPSIRATGTTKLGSKVVVYAHVSNRYADHRNLRTNTADRQHHNGAGRLAQEDFQCLVDLDGITDGDCRRVWVLDYDTLQNATSGLVSLASALDHPQTIPFLGSALRAQAYLAAHRAAYGMASIGVWHSSDFDPHSARARLLVFGSNGSYGLCGGNYLRSDGRFLGVAPEPQSRARQ